MKSITSEEKIHIALSPYDLTDDYNRHAGVTLLSILKHSSKPITAHLFYDETLSVGKEENVEYNKACYKEIADQYNCELLFHHIKIPEWIHDHKCTRFWSAGTLLRLWIPDTLTNVNKVIYFDCDMVIRTDIANIWNTQMEKYYIGACKDYAAIDIYKNKRNYKPNKVIDEYFNAGLIIMNLELIRKQQTSFIDLALTYIYQHPNNLFNDQDMLNWYCNGEYMRLERKYNLPSFCEDILAFQDDCIIHYTVGKPWLLYSGDVDEFYWECLSETPWGKDKRKYIQYLRSAPDYQKALSFIEKTYYKLDTGGAMKRLWGLIQFTMSLWINSFHAFRRYINIYLMGKIEL